MFRLLYIEWLKLKSYNVFVILAVIYLIALPAILSIGKTIEVSEDYFSNQIFFMFPNVWQYLGYVGNCLTFFVLGFLAILLITNEYSYKTLRQNIISGYSRGQFFQAKLVAIITISAVSTLYYTLVALAFGYTNTETIFLSKITQYADLIPRYFLMCLSYMSIAMLIALTVRRTGLAIFLYFSYALFIERILRYAIHFRIFENKSIHFYPINATSDLVPFTTPFNNAAEEFLDKNNFSLFLSPTEATITAAIYTLFFLYLSYQLLQKSDL